MQTTVKISPNKKQSECINSIDGSIMVLAGPGTGKTFTVIERIKNMLSLNIPPDKILCLTFSDAAASEMKKRLVQKSPQLGPLVNIYTYHSFCWEMIQNYPGYFEEFSNAQIINDTTKRNYIKQCLQEHGTSYFKTASGDSYFHAGTIINRIDEIKKNLLTKEEYFYNLEHHPDWQKGLDDAREIMKNTLAQGKKVTKKLESQIADLEKKIGQARELWEFYELYTQKMRENNLIDFNDMISLVLKKFDESASFLNTVAGMYDYFLVDEYQDTNKAQNSLVFSLCDAKEEKNIFVVGDDDQIIFGFQGAQIDNIEKFLEKYPQTKVICLDENMRSTQSILNLSEQVAKQDPNRLEANPKFASYNIQKHLIAKNPSITQKDNTPVLRLYDDIIQEYNAIVDEIENIIKNGAQSLSEIAILTKTNGELEEFCELLKARNIPFELKEGKSIFSCRASILAIFYLKMLQNPKLNADKVFPLLLCEPFCININDYNDILAKSYLHKNRDFIADIKDMSGHNWQEPQKIEKFLNDYDYLFEAKSSLNIYQLTLEVINKTGLLEYFIKNPHNCEENICALKKLADEAKNLLSADKKAGLDDFIEYLDEALDNNTPILAQKPPVVQNAVQLITMHSSKGREFEYVFIPTLEEYKWERAKNDTISPKIPLSRVIKDDEKEALKISEKIKLLFVGITRAKHTLYLSMPKIIGGKEKRLTKFISSIEPPYLERREISYTKDNFTNELIKSLKYEYDYKKEFQNFIRSYTESLSLSPSMLNTYLRCPRQFLYSYVLRINSLASIDDRLGYGSAVHKTIENFSKNAKQNQSYASVEEFLEDFKIQCAKTPFSNRDERNNYLKKGLDNLRTFYSQLIQTPPGKIFSTELNIESQVNSQIKINGKIDRLELNDDGSYTVIDFKTGSAKKSYEIKDGGAYESYLNQLRFYKYLVEKKYDNTVSVAKLVFAEQCNENFQTSLSEEDNIIIEEKIKNVWRNIVEQNFEPLSDTKNCVNCAYKSTCGLNLL